MKTCTYIHNKSVFGHTETERNLIHIRWVHVAVLKSPYSVDEIALLFYVLQTWEARLQGVQDEEAIEQKLCHEDRLIQSMYISASWVCEWLLFESFSFFTLLPLIDQERMLHQHIFLYWRNLKGD
ncbi:hypothetical protein I3843_04G063400 [Carya illinoinensis]|nr:hypothetical protein I3843_04G063400 [Carya illinoinensis]